MKPLWSTAPETVSTDYDTSDRLYFEPVTLEDVLEIVRVEKPVGVIVQYGGQTPLKICRELEAAGVPIIGTSLIRLTAPKTVSVSSKWLSALVCVSRKTRPRAVKKKQLVLQKTLVTRWWCALLMCWGGRAMEIVYDEEELKRYMREAVQVSNDSPVLLDHFLNCAIEVDVDAVCDGKTVVIGAIMQHIEQAGVHSGDSACSLPPYSLPAHIQDEIRDQVRRMA